jgi:hypothetical protein
MDSAESRIVSVQIPPPPPIDPSEMMIDPIDSRQRHGGSHGVNVLGRLGVEIM